jgi:hypothetical protein
MGAVPMVHWGCDNSSQPLACNAPLGCQLPHAFSFPQLGQMRSARLGISWRRERPWANMLANTTVMMNLTHCCVRFVAGDLPWGCAYHPEEQT